MLVEGAQRADKLAKLITNANSSGSSSCKTTPRGEAAEDAENAQTTNTHTPKWERLPSGTAIRVWWASAEEYYDAFILEWRIGYDENKQLSYTHRCQYPGGVIEHDLSKTEFEVISIDEEGLHDEFEDGEGLICTTHRVNAVGDVSEQDGEATPRGFVAKRWLEQQEAGLDKDRVEVTEAEERHSGDQAGRKAMRRVRMKASSLLPSPLKKPIGAHA